MMMIIAATTTKSKIGPFQLNGRDEGRGGQQAWSKINNKKLYIHSYKSYKSYELISVCVCLYIYIYIYMCKNECE